MDKFKTILWFAYDILFSFLITNSLAFLILDKLTFFKWYWLMLFIIVFLISGFYMISFIRNDNRLLKSLKGDMESADSRLDLNLTYLPIFGFIVAFGLINQQLFLFDNSLFHYNNNIAWSLNSNFDFLLYTYDNFIRAACLDFMETYNLHISRISSSNYWILTILFFYKTFLSIYLIKFLLKILKGLQKIKIVANS